MVAAQAHVDGLKLQHEVAVEAAAQARKVLRVHAWRAVASLSLQRATPALATRLPRTARRRGEGPRAAANRAAAAVVGAQHAPPAGQAASARAASGDAGFIAAYRAGVDIQRQSARPPERVGVCAAELQREARARTSRTRRSSGCRSSIAGPLFMCERWLGRRIAGCLPAVRVAPAAVPGVQAVAQLPPADAAAPGLVDLQQQDRRRPPAVPL